MIRRILYSWDRLGIYTLIMLFGVHTVIYPLVSVRNSSPTWASWLLGMEFFAAGALLMVGWISERRRYRLGGLMVLGQCLTTVALVIMAYGGFRSFGFACLMGAFALQAVWDIRLDYYEHKRRKEAEAKLVEELDQLVRETRPDGDGP